MEEYDVISWGGYKIALGVSSKADASRLLNDVDGFGFNSAWGGDPNLIASLTGYKCLVIGDAENFNENLSGFKGAPEYVSLTGVLDLINLEDAVFRNVVRAQFELVKNTQFVGNVPNLETLAIRGKSELSMELLNGFPGIQALEIIHLKISHFDGIQELDKLSKLTLSHINSTIPLTSLAESKIKDLTLDSCKKIDSYQVLGEMSELKKLTMDHCPSIENLNFVGKSTTLEFFCFTNTYIESGDLTPLFKLKYAGFFDDENYSHTEKEIKNGVTRGGAI